MKKFLFLFLFPLLAVAQTNTVNPTYTFTDFNLNPQAVKRVTQTPLAPLADFNGAILTASPIAQITSGAGSVTFSNTASGYAYRIQLDTPYGSTVRTTAFPVAISGNVNGRDYLGTLQKENFYYLYLQNAAHLLPGDTTTNLTIVNGTGTFAGNVSAATNYGFTNITYYLPNPNQLSLSGFTSGDTVGDVSFLNGIWTKSGTANGQNVYTNGTNGIYFDTGGVLANSWICTNAQRHDDTSPNVVAFLQTQAVTNPVPTGVGFPQDGVSANTMTGAVSYPQTAPTQNPALFADPFNTDTIISNNWGFIRPETFGAVGDGVADDTAAVQNSWNVAYAGWKLSKRALTVRMVPQVTYKCSSHLVLPGPMTIEGNCPVEGGVWMGGIFYPTITFSGSGTNTGIWHTTNDLSGLIVRSIGIQGPGSGDTKSDGFHLCILPSTDNAFNIGQTLSLQDVDIQGFNIGIRVTNAVFKFAGIHTKDVAGSFVIAGGFVQACSLRDSKLFFRTNDILVTDGAKLSMENVDSFCDTGGAGNFSVHNLIVTNGSGVTLTQANLEQGRPVAIVDGSWLHFVSGAVDHTSQLPPFWVKNSGVLVIDGPTLNYVDDGNGCVIKSDNSNTNNIYANFGTGWNFKITNSVNGTLTTVGSRSY